LKADDGTQNEAELILGESISNFKTIQSFGHEDEVVNRFEEIVSIVEGNNFCDNLWSSIILFIANFLE